MPRPVDHHGSMMPKVPRRLGVRGCCEVVNRGVAAWKGKIFVGTFDGRLVALDAKTGQPVWTVMTVDPDKAYTNTMAPRVIKGRVMIGVAGGEYGVRGYISAYDAETGTLAWRFYTVPRRSLEAIQERGHGDGCQALARRVVEKWGAAARCGSPLPTIPIST
jgi:glucose dehydrogenase